MKYLLKVLLSWASDEAVVTSLILRRFDLVKTCTACPYTLSTKTRFLC
jgi:hypothetical protein